MKVVERIAQEFNTVRSEISTAISSVPSTPIPVSSQLSGSYSISNTEKKLAMGKFLYTGNGTSKEINIGLSSIDFTQATNGTGYYHDRTAGDCIVKDDAGNIVESGEISFKNVSGVDGIIKVHIKSRSLAYNNYVFDGLRGVGEWVETNSTDAEQFEATFITDFTSNGYMIGSGTGINQNSATYVAYIELYTHIKWGLTSQGKRYIEAYNPNANIGMIMYQGSGVSGHQIPHSLGVKIDYAMIKNLNAAVSWPVFTGGSSDLFINSTSAYSSNGYFSNSTASALVFGASTSTAHNALNQSYILYGKAKSAYWTCGIYQGTGASGNFVETKDYEGNAREPHELITKRIDSTSWWAIQDNKRDSDDMLGLNVSNAELNGYSIVYSSNGFTLNHSQNEGNASGGQYFYQATLLPKTYPNDLDSNFDMPSNTSNLIATDGICSISNGYNANSGVDNKIVTLSGQVTPSNGWED